MGRKHKGLSLLLTICLLAMPLAAGAAEQNNPLIFPSESVAYVSYPDTIINILLLGIDFGRPGYWGSGLKDTITDCHTDAVMVMAINLTQNKIDIISIPRDTVTIVPGVRGVYKLNAAVNCADTLAGGLERTQASVEKLLGGVKITGYFAVDMGAMFTLGDALGGIEYDVDMNYYGGGGRKYVRGLQHLDGQGIMDYVRARKNATIDGTDLGRTRRQREMMTAILQKLASDSGSALRVLDAMADPANGVFTNMSGAKAVGFVSMASLLMQGGDMQIHSYTMEGSYQYAMKWNFTFTNEKARAEVLQTVYGVEMPQLQYVSRKHADFYEDAGFYDMHLINICTELKKDLKGKVSSMTPEQKDLWEQLLPAYDEAVQRFGQACDTLAFSDISKMQSACVTMRDLAIALTESMEYPQELPWRYSRVEWYLDPYTNEFQLDWR